MTGRGSPLVEGCMPSSCMRRVANATDSWLWLATINSALPSATASSTRATHLHQDIH